MKRLFLVVAIACLALENFPCIAVESPALRWNGDVTEANGETLVKGRSAAVIIGAADAEVYRVTAEVKFVAEAPRGVGMGAAVIVMPEDLNDLKKVAAFRADIGREREGNLLHANLSRYSPAPGPREKTEVRTLTFWAVGKKGEVEIEGVPRRTWHDRWIGVQVDASAQKLLIWIEGLLVGEVERRPGLKGPVAIQLSTGDRLRAVRMSQPDPLFLPVDFSAIGRGEKAAEKKEVRVSGVPFLLPADAQSCLSLKQAQWINWEKDFPWSHESPNPAMSYDPRMTVLQVPVEDYVMAHVLAVAADDSATSAAITLRAGRFSKSGNEQNVQFDFRGEVPRRSTIKDATQTPAGAMSYVPVPMAFGFAQDIVAPAMHIEVTKDVRLARHAPDPNRFRYRPLGLPSGVTIAAITIERSPLQMRVTSKETAHAFVEPQKPEFFVTLRNITPVGQEFRVTFQATHLDGTKTEVRVSGRVSAGQTVEQRVEIPTSKRGYHDLVAILESGQRTLLRRETSFALLPPDTRKHRDQSPFGTYNFGGAHYTSNDMDAVGPLYVKLGMRYGMFSAPAEVRQKFGLLKGNEPQAAVYEKFATDSTVPKAALIFHETSISGRHITRVPDLFHDFPRYVLSESEEKRFATLWTNALAVGKQMRAAHPDVRLLFGNGPLPTKEEFFRRKLPAEIFDAAGNEALGSPSLPETQPPNWLGNNSSLWMDRQMLDAYGYGAKAIDQCHEVCYPSTNPGNLDPATQADYFVRHAIHSLAWGVPAFRPGILTDVGGNYRWSHWGSSGFCRMAPEMNVKPAFVAFATMTHVLDGAKFVRDVPTGSASLYVVEFAKQEGENIFVAWTIRGRRPARLRVSSGALRFVDSQSNETALTPRDGVIEIATTPSPVYLVGAGKVIAVEPGQPEYREQPQGKTALISPLSTMADWTMEKSRNPELEFYDFMQPRRKGDFAFDAVAEFEGRKNVLRVTPRAPGKGKDTVSSYAVLTHRTGLPLPGTPTEIGVTINGNSGWGRVMFELTDASGQRWISIGATMKGDAAAILPKAIVDQFPNPALGDWNTDDAWELSRINFDGWRYVGFPLPGNYPGEGYHWPANSNWRSDKDGKVHYPLTLRKLIVELPQKVLHVKSWAPPPRAEIYLSDLTVAQGDTVLVKRIVRE